MSFFPLLPPIPTLQIRTETFSAPLAVVFPALRAPPVKHLGRVRNAPGKGRLETWQAAFRGAPSPRKSYFYDSIEGPDLPALRSEGGLYRH